MSPPYCDADDVDAVDQPSSAPSTATPIAPRLLRPHSDAPVPGDTADFLPSSSPNPSRPSSPKRSSSPLPLHYGGTSSSYSSDTDSEPSSPLLRGTSRAPWDNTPRWWPSSQNANVARRRRRRHETAFGLRTLKRYARRIVRMRYFPRHPGSIIFTLLALVVSAILITLLLMHILNPDKAPLPWRAYCSVPQFSTRPPSVHLSPKDENFTLILPSNIDPTSPEASPYTSPFPPPHFDDLPPAGVFLGVFSLDSGVERRMLIRSTYASQVRSRNGADPGDGGNGTSRTIVRFILGKPRRDWERRVQLEMDTYNDIVVLPIAENMNNGKTHAYFTWAADNAWVPSLEPSLPFSAHPHSFSYSNDITPPPAHLAAHDPHFPSTSTQPWVRPDYVLKVDDDAFVMLAELEGRLRAELDKAVLDKASIRMQRGEDSETQEEDQRDIDVIHRRVEMMSTGAPHRNITNAGSNDPMIYWGYLVKNRFMAGELYGLSYSLVKWVSVEPSLKSLSRGAEDKQTSKWMRLHPRADEIRWASERCWVYDHPRAGTVYSHGFLFPSEVTRVKHRVLEFLMPVKSQKQKTSLAPVPPSSVLESPTHSPNTSVSPTSITYTLPYPGSTLPSGSTPSYSYSSVTRFGTHYTFPLPSLSSYESIEALVEGSHMSKVFEGGPETASQAWARREGRRTRYEGRRLGGTVVVHFIKRNEWFLETAMALLGGEDADPDPVEGRGTMLSSFT